MPGTLYIIPTPIGNLEDITLRALRVLSEVDIIASEDTRHTGLLLQRYEIKKPLVSYEEYNEQRRIPELLNRLQEGQNIALVSDAGTPALSDPGYKLIRQALIDGYAVDVLPGASSIVVGLVGSGLPTDKFYYGGFLARTSAKRQKAFQAITDLTVTLVFFESPHRLAATLADALVVFGDRQAVVARELTKLHQQYDARSLSDLANTYSLHQAKGEIVLIIAGKPS